MATLTHLCPSPLNKAREGATQSGRAPHARAEGHRGGTRQEAALQTASVQADNTHLRSLPAFSWLDRSFLFSAEPSAICLLKGILVASEFRQLRIKLRRMPRQVSAQTRVFSSVGGNQRA